MAERLERTRIRQLLEQADQKWFKNHSGKFAYQEHLDFTADYLVKNYNRTTRSQKVVSGTPGKKNNRGQ